MRDGYPVKCEDCGKDGYLKAKPEYHVYCGECIARSQSNNKKRYLGRR